MIIYDKILLEKNQLFIGKYYENSFNDGIHIFRATLQY